MTEPNPSPWNSLVDPNSGATYYFNSITKVTTWTRPTELDSTTHTTAAGPPPTPSKKPPPPLPSSTRTSVEASPVLQPIAFPDDDIGHVSVGTAAATAPATTQLTVTPPTPVSTVTTKPPIIDIPGTQWSQVLDVASGNYYYANKETFEVNWNVPPEVLAAQTSHLTISASTPSSSPATTPASSPSSLSASTPIPDSTGTLAAPSHQHRPSFNSYVRPTQDFGITHEFDRVLDSNTQRFYYVHKQTQAVQWDTPASWLKHQEMEAAQQANQTSALPGGRTNFGTAPSDLAAAVAANLERRGSHSSSKSWGQQPDGSPIKAKGPPPLPSTSIPTVDENSDSVAPVMVRKTSMSRGPPPLPASFLQPPNHGPSSSLSSLTNSAPPLLSQEHRHSASHAGLGVIPNSPSANTPGLFISPSSTPASTPKVGGGSGSTLSTPQAAQRTSSIIHSSTPSASSTSSHLGLDGKPHVLDPRLKADIHQFALKSFASEHFRTFREKSGFLSKGVAIDMNEVLSFQKTPIAKSLLLSTKKFSSDAVSLFKKILTFMGDNTDSGMTIGGKKNPQVLASEIVSIGVKNAPLRDEIYCQLCKQTKLNPEPMSCAAGWRLMVLVCAAFAPTRTFQEHLSKYFLENYDVLVPPEAAILSRYCQWKMQKTIKEGADEKLTLQQVEELGRVGVRSYHVLFPGDLEYIVWCQVQEHNAISTTVPEIMIQMCDLIRRSGGFGAKGIFRIAAQREHIQSARAKIEAGRYGDLDPHDHHTPADVLKVWLRELVTPLIPMNLYDQCLKVCDNEAECMALVEKELAYLPAHVATLDYLMTFLADLATHQKETMMSEENLAIVFSQDILRTEEKDPMMLFKNSPREKNFVRSLITGWAKRVQQSNGATSSTQ